MLKTLLILIFVSTLPFTVVAQDDVVEDVTAHEGHLYSPDYCEFGITFPEEPYINKKCDEGGKCYQQVSYTKVFNMSSTVNFKVICSEINADVRQSYSGAVMEATLKAMTENTLVQTFDTSFREEEQYKQAGLVGEGKVGQMPTIFIAQLWIGDQSALSVEAELIGEAAEAPDQMFSNILKSALYLGKDKGNLTTKPNDSSALNR